MKGLDYTQGNVNRLLAATSIPMLLASMVNITTQMANLFFMGHTTRDVLYVLSLYIPISFLVIALVEGLQISAQVAVSRSRERGKAELTSLYSHYSAAGLILALAALFIIWIALPSLHWVYGISEHAAPSFDKYAMGMLAAAIPAFLGSVTNAFLRGLGRTGTASIIAVCTAIANVLLVYCLVSIGRLELTGVVCAGLISSSGSLIAAVLVLVRTRSLEYSLSGINMSQLRMLKYVGVPVFASYCLIFVSTFFFNRIISPFGEAALAGFGAGYRIQTMVLLPGIAIGSAIGILINQNLAPHLRLRAYEGYKKGMLHSCVVYLVIALTIWLAKEPLVSFLISDPVSAREAVQFLNFVALSYAFLGPMMTTLLTMEQTGKGYTAFFLNAAYFGIVIVMGWILAVSLERVEAFYACMLAGNVCGVCVHLPVLRMYKRKFSQTTSQGDDELKMTSSY